MTNSYTKENRLPGPVRKAEGRRLNRVGSRVPHSATVSAMTLGQRMAVRRMELKLTQDQVAKQVQFQPKSGRKKGAERPLSRAAYAMFEIDQAEPGLKKIEAIATILNVSPGWLAFGKDSSLDDANSTPSIDERSNEGETVWVIPRFVRASQGDLDLSNTPAIIINIRR